MPELHITPNQFDSIQQYLTRLGFTVNRDYFVCGIITFPIAEISGYTPSTFAAKMKARGWMPVEVRQIQWPLR